MACATYECPQCHDGLIHLNNRGPHEAASGFLQFIHNSLPRTMDTVDVDVPFHIIRRQLDPPLRYYIEHKRIGGGLSDSQKFHLPREAQDIADGIAARRWHPDSGVFVVWSDPPYTHGEVRRFHTDSTMGNPVQLTGPVWETFLRAEPDAPFIS